MLDEQFQKEFKEKAIYSPYPVVFPHDGHYAIIYLDHDFGDRGVIISDLEYKGKTITRTLNHHKEN